MCFDVFIFFLFFFFLENSEIQLSIRDFQFFVYIY